MFALYIGEITLTTTYYDLRLLTPKITPKITPMENIDLFIPQPSERKAIKKATYKKPDEVKELERLYLEMKKHKYPGNTFVTGRKFKDDSANALTECCVWWIRLHGGSADRINNTGVYDPFLKRFRKSGTRKGIADIIGLINGRYIAVEVKFGKDRQSEEQKKVQAEIEEAGGVYIIARTFTQFVEEFSSCAKNGYEKSN